MKSFLRKAFGPSLVLLLIATLLQASVLQDASPPEKAPGSYNKQGFNDISLHKEENEKLADHLCEIILSHALTRDVEAEGCGISDPSQSLYGHAQLRKNILHLIQNAEPLTFSIVGFPFKSGNTEKNVIGALPDLAERLALQTLQGMTDAIHHFYPPGAKVQIYTDGLAFCDLLGIPLKTVLLYEKSLKQLAADLPSISIITPQDLLPDQSPQEIQAYIQKQNVPSHTLKAREQEVLRKKASKRARSH